MEKERNVARRESVVRNRRRQPVKKESYTEEKENGGHKARSLARPPARSWLHARSLESKASRKIFPRARLRSSFYDS